MGTGEWHLRTHDDEYGPVTRERLVEWARMGRIQPGQEVSEDGENWTPVTDVPFLDMRWSIDIGDGTPRGPFNRAAAQALLDSGRLPKGSRMVEVAPPPQPAPDTPAVGAEGAEAESAEAEDAETPVAAEAPAAETSGAVAETQAVAGGVAEAPSPSAASEEEVAELRRQIETLQAGLTSALSRAAEAEGRAAAARREAEEMRNEADRANARLAVAAAEADAARVGEAAAKAAADEAAQKAAAAESDLADLSSSAHASELEYEDRIQKLSDEIKRLPPTARLTADAQSAIYTLMREEADELAREMEADARELEELRRLRLSRSERLLARRQQILRCIGADADDMTRRALKKYPDDPRMVHLRQELDALRVLQERTAADAERKVGEMASRLRERESEVVRLRQQVGDVGAISRQLQETRERLKARERELVEERQRHEAERHETMAAQQTLLSRLSALEQGLPGGTRQSREARNVRLAPWMGLRQ